MANRRLGKNPTLRFITKISLLRAPSPVLVCTLAVLFCLFAFPGRAQKVLGPPAPLPQARMSRYEIDVTPKPGPALDKPQRPYKAAYVFTPENDWFTQNSPVWNAILDGFKNTPDLRYLEVGCYEGRSAVWMLENVLTEPSSTLTCIDPFLEQFGGQIAKQRFLANAQTASGPNRVDVIEGYSQVELRELPLHSFHIIYIDGDHVARAVLEDAVLSWRLLKAGGLIIFDDYAWEHQREPPFRPLMAIDFFTEVFRGQVEVLHRDYQVILKKIQE